MKNFAILLLLILTVSCKQKIRKLPYYNSADFTPRWNISKTDTGFHKIRSFNLTDQSGKPFTEKNMEGKICIVDFFFTSCPGICPKLTKSMADIQKKFLNDSTVLLLSHTVTPQKDDVTVLKKYAADNGVRFEKWRLLTGNVKEIYDLGRKYYYIEEDLGLKRDSSVFLHTENFVLIDKERHLRGIYNGLDKNSIAALAKDIDVLEKNEKLP